jgi:N-acyl-L-homoserine lactone synthetase
MTLLAITPLERVASELIEAVDPLRVTVAVGEHLDDVFRLRFLAALEHGWIGEGDVEDGLERDALDDDATYVVALDGDAVVATARLIAAGEHARPPLAQAFGVHIGVPAVQLDRLTIASEHRGDPQHRLLLAVLARAALEVGARGAGHIVGAASSRLIALYRSLGIDVAPIGVPRRYWGERRQLFMVDLERTGRTLRALP